MSIAKWTKVFLESKGSKAHISLASTLAG